MPCGASRPLTTRTASPAARRHLAARRHPRPARRHHPPDLPARPGARDEAVYRGVFVDGLRNVLAALDASHLQRIVFVSSSAVYGEHRGGWVDGHAARAARLQRPHPAGSRGIAGSPTRIRHGAATGRPVGGPAATDRAAAFGPGRRAVEPRIGPTASTSMTRRLPSRTWPCCPPSRPCTSAATIRHCTSCTPTARGGRARAAHRARARQRGQQETQQRAAARQRPAPAMAGLAAGYAALLAEGERA